MSKCFSVAIILFLASCSSAPPVKPPERPQINAQAVSLLTDNCEPDRDNAKVICDLQSFHQGLLGCIGYLEAAGLCRNDLKACKAMSIVDVEELKANVAFERAEKEAAERARWWWGLGGVGVGAVVVGLLVGLLR